MTLKNLSLSGVAAAVVFAATVILFSAITPGYNHLTQGVSELGMSNAPQAFLWNLLGFGVVGALILVFAASLYLEFNDSRAGVFIAVLTGASGLG